MAVAKPGAPLHFVESPQPRVSVIVTGYRSAPHLEACLRSLQAELSLPAEVLVTLNEPEAALVSRLEAVVGITLTVSSVNLGFGGAVNRAAATARAAFLVLLNDDTVVEPGWIDSLVSAADADSAAGAVGSKVLAPDGSVREDGTVLWADATVTLVDDYYRPDPPPAPGVRRTDYCSAVSLLVRREAWEQVGGFDEGYFPAYYEDVDLCLKLQGTGRHVLYQPSSVVRHHQGASASLRYRRFLLDRNAARLRARWAHVLTERPPADPHNPAAVSKAVAAAAQRPCVAGRGPLIPDLGPPRESGDVHYLSMQLAVATAYTHDLEQELSAWDRHGGRRLLKRLTERGKALARPWPGLYRAVARRARRPAQPEVRP